MNGQSSEEAFEVLQARLDQEGVICVTLEDLKAIEGVKRLGRYVLGDIGERLKRAQIGYFPVETIDNNQEPRYWQELRLYRDDRTSVIAGVINAVLHPSTVGDAKLVALRAGVAQERVNKRDAVERAFEALEDAHRELESYLDDGDSEV